jgi:hypothetical protein
MKETEYPYTKYYFSSHELCFSATSDALSCAQDVIDTSCKPEEGRNEFDTWIHGLQGIYTSVCEDNFDKLKSNYVQCETAQLVDCR